MANGIPFDPRDIRQEAMSIFEIISSVHNKYSGISLNGHSE